MQSTEPGSPASTTSHDSTGASFPGAPGHSGRTPPTPATSFDGRPATLRPIFQQLSTSAKYAYRRNDYIKRFAWEWVQRTLIRFSPKRAHAWRRFWLRLFGTKIPSTSGTKATTIVVHPWLLTMGEHCWLAERVTIYNLGPIHIGDHTVISQDSYICSGTHDYRKPNLPIEFTTVRIGSGVWICAGAFVGPSVTIGDNSVIGARAVVMSDIAPNMVAAGNPAKALKRRKMEWEDGTVT
ncbi:MAG: putative colanic acid biosynthesis acetyltransferase [Pyrinomonadaceae bacterium]|nr:putative colanic acid biosynthesis acetyltransferase [Phycisphaerales bacterium]